MNKLIDKFKHEIQEGIHPYVIASEFYLEFTNIHPFPDGNGRTARLFLNTFLASQGFQPLVFSDKQEFDHYHDKSRLEPKSLIEYFFMMVGWNIRNYKYLT